MAEPNPMQDDWKQPAFRNNVVQQLEMARRNSQTPMNKTSAEMEDYIFQRAKSKAEYINYIQKVLSQVNGKKKAEMAAAQQQQQQNQMMMNQGGMNQMNQMGMIRQPQPGGVDQSPINALQNLAGQRGGAGMVNRGQPQMGMMQNMSGMVTPQHQPQQMDMMRPPHMQPGRNPHQMHPGMHRPQMQRQDAFMVTTPQPMPGMPGQPMPSSSVNQIVYQGQGGPPIRSMVPMGMPGQYMQNRDPNMVPIQMQQSPGQGSPLQMIPSPVGPHQGMMPSPMAVRQQHMGVPSPNTNLHTPGSAVAEQSPAAPRQSQEEQEYKELLEKLSRFIEPVRKSIQDSEKKTDEDSIKNRNKLKTLLGVLTDPNSRVKMDVLRKCESALFKLTASQMTPSADTHMCQALLDAVAHFSTTSSLNHSLYRSFGPALEAYTGPAIKPPSPPPSSRKRKAEPENPNELPDHIQGEIARLGRRFVVSVDQRFHAGSDAFHLVCRLEELQLPSVPPLLVTLPKTYPRTSPQCDPEDCSGYDATEFFRDVAANLKVHLTNMPNRYCLTQLLSSWEMSVRKACDPVNPSICQPNPIFVT